jgi:hypothetical protein
VSNLSNPNPPSSPSPEDREALLRSRNWSEKLRDEEPKPTPASFQNDPAAHEMHRRSEAFNAQAHRALNQIPVPSDLRAKILAKAQAAHPEKTQSQSPEPKIITVPHWRTPRAIALAAALAFMATGITFWITAPRENQSFAGYRSRMIGFALREYRMDIHTNNLAEVQKFLAQNGAPAEFNLPSPLAQTPVKGGATLTWQGRPVSMVCFDRLNTTLYMFVIDQTAAPVNPAQEISTFKNLATATWTSGEKTFLLAGRVPLEELERLVKS